MILLFLLELYKLSEKTLFWFLHFEIIVNLVYILVAVSLAPIIFNLQRI